jgi:hypothetical protein
MTHEDICLGPGDIHFGNFRIRDDGVVFALDCELMPFLPTSFLHFALIDSQDKSLARLLSNILEYPRSDRNVRNTAGLVVQCASSDIRKSRVSIRDEHVRMLILMVRTQFFPL